MATAYLTDESFTKHDFSRHPEHAGRIKAVWRELGVSGLADQVLRMTPTPATNEQILAVHTDNHLQRLDAVAQGERRARLDPDTYALPVSPEVARLAAGAVIGAVDAVLSARADNALAIVRPPGHHATADRQMGFCLLNNVAIAARHSQAQHGVEKVVILDYDVHHGNGTNDIFYADPSVLFISIHQYPFYPGSGALDEIGKNAGRGATINLPLGAGYGDIAYQALFAEIIRPAIERFEPDLMLISAGFDAHWIDPLASMQLTLAGYDYLARECMKLAERLCGGRIVFVMEGGYDLTALAKGWCNIARALLGQDEISDPYGAPSAPAKADVQALIDELRRVHRL